MQQIVYAMQFRGEAAPSSDGAMHAITSSPSTRIMSSVSATAVSSQIDAVDGDRADFVSIVHMTGDTGFKESGTFNLWSGQHTRVQHNWRRIYGAKPDGRDVVRSDLVAN